MSIDLMTLAWKSELPTGPKMVLLALCDNANDAGNCYPSVKTLTVKCSMSERSVFNHLKDLENIGAVARIERPGRSTVYQLDPARFVIRSDESHYIYRIEDVESGEFYIGLRTCQGDVSTDGYMGSGAWFNERVSNGRALKKQVLHKFATRDEAAAAERELIEQSRTNPLCMNKRTPANSAPLTPADSAAQPLQILHPTPANSAATPATVAPITITQPTHSVRKNKKATPDIERPEQVDAEVWSAYLAVRKTKKAGPMSDIALQGLQREATKAGLTLGEAVRTCVERGWQSLRADWLEPKHPARTGQTRSRHAGAAAAIFDEATHV